MKKLFIVLLTFFCLASLSVKAQDWKVIAEKTVNFKAEKDVVNPMPGERKVDKIRIKCIQGTVKLKKVRVFMADGTEKEYDAKGVGVLTNGMTSLAWDLPGKGGEPALKKIELEYDSVGNILLTKRAKVEVEARMAGK